MHGRLWSEPRVGFGSSLVGDFMGIAARSGQNSGGMGPVTWFLVARLWFTPIVSMKMKGFRQARLVLATCWFMWAYCLTLIYLPLAIAQSVQWDSESGLISADFRGVSLGKALESVAEQTGWDIYVEPGLQARRVQTRFTALPQGEALRRMLGDLNHALLGGEGGKPSRLMVYALNLAGATERIEIAEQVTLFTSTRLGNELIVQIKPGSELTIEALAESLGARIVGRVEGLDAYRLSFEDEALADKARETLKDSDVVQISDNYQWTYRGDPLSYPQSLGLPELRLRPSDGAGQGATVVGLIDMPVQAEGSNLAPFLLPGINVTGEEAPVSNLPSHGTTMAHTVLKGVEVGLDGAGETNVRILPIDVYGASETTSTFEVVAGIYQAVEAGANVINLSLGGNEPVPFMEQLIDQASSQGILFVGAAGNTPGTEAVFPAAYPGVLAVTASDRNGTPAPYANTGGFVDVMAPGRTYMDFNGTTYMVNGTSASAAYISGLAASLSSTTGRPVQAIALDLKASLPGP